MAIKHEKNKILSSLGIMSEEKKKEQSEENILVAQMKMRQQEIQNEFFQYLSNILNEAQIMNEIARANKSDEKKEKIAEENERIALENLVASEQMAKRFADAAREASDNNDATNKPSSKEDEQLLTVLAAAYKADNEKRAAMETLVLADDKLQHLSHEERLDLIDARNSAMDRLGITDNHFDRSDVENGFLNAAAKYQPEMMLGKSDEEQQFARDELAKIVSAKQSLLDELNEKQLEAVIKPDDRNQALQTLNLSNENPNESEIKAAYKKELLANNPQKIAQQGGSVEEIEAAQARLADIKEARDLLLTSLENTQTSSITLSPAPDSNLTPIKKAIDIAELKDEAIAQTAKNKNEDNHDTHYSPSMHGLD